MVFLERDRGRAKRMQQRLRLLLPSLRVTADRPLGPTAADPLSVEHLRSVGYDSESKHHAFVAMPFDSSFEDVFYYGIAPPIRAAGLLCERVDQISFTGDVVVQLKDRISRAQFLVADLTGANPNVYLEVGYAWGRGVPTVLLCDKVDDLRFDVRGHRCVVYSSIRDLESKLEKEISGLLPTGGRPDR